MRIILTTRSVSLGLTLGQAKKLKVTAQKNGKVLKRTGPRRHYSRNSPFYGVPFNQVAQPTSGVYHAPTVVAAGQPSQFKTGGLLTTGFGPCFECGMPGHLRKYGPKFLAGKVGGASSK